MTKKHEMSDQEYAIYKKQHPYEDVVETEQAKIRREKASYARHRLRSERQLQQSLRQVVAPDDVDDVAEVLEDTDDEQAAERVLRNARTHKKRLVGLRKHEAQEANGNLNQA
jgi:hypothetical protein